MAEVRASFRHTDVVGEKTVFNIKGNDYRLIVHINYQAGIIYIKYLLTHVDEEDFRRKFTAFMALAAGEEPEPS